MGTAPVSSSSSLDPVRSTAARQSAAADVVRISPISSATTEPTPSGNLSIKKSDTRSTPTLTGSQTPDVPKVLSLFRSRIRLYAPDGTSVEAVDYHSVRYLPLLVRDEAANIS